MYGRSCVNVKVEPRLTFTCTRGLSYNALFYLRAFARKKYATVEINPNV